MKFIYHLFRAKLSYLYSSSYFAKSNEAILFICQGMWSVCIKITCTPNALPACKPGERVINKQRAKVQGMCDIPSSSYSARVSPKTTVNNMDTPCWSTSERLQHVGAPLSDSNMVVGNQWKHLEFTLALSKRFFSLLNLKTFAQAPLLTYWLLRTRKHKADRNFRARNMLPRYNADDRSY